MDCILHDGWISSNGYGLVAAATTGRRLAHRVAYEQANGPIPKGMIVMHTCDTRACINPDHLVLGTQGDNMQDMAAKGRAHGQDRTHCPQGHPYSDTNTYLSGRGTERQCRTCRQAQAWKTSARRKEERRARKQVH
jgi:HNH endonuclease